MVIPSDRSDPIAVPNSQLSIQALREVVARPSPLDAFLRDPEVKSLLSRKSSSRSISHSLFRRGSSRSLAQSHTQANPDDSRSSADADDSDSTVQREIQREVQREGHTPRSSLHKATSSISLMNTILTDEARSTSQLRSALQGTLSRLEAESRKALEATARADRAERLLKDMAQRLSTSETGRATAHTEAAEMRYETAMIQLRSAREAKAASDAEVIHAKEKRRRAELALADVTAREEGRSAGVRSAMKRNFELGHEEGHAEGHEEGYQAGHADGFDLGRDEGFQAGRLAAFEDGRARGRAEGFKEGYDLGHRDAREDALEMVNSVIDSESRGPSPGPQNRTKMWLRRRPTGESIATTDVGHD
jgi:flagellar biosynthesis/type III secretory pathway protein FliH